MNFKEPGSQLASFKFKGFDWILLYEWRQIFIKFIGPFLVFLRIFAP